MSTVSTEAQFSKWRARIWPIHGYEMKKFLPMALIMCCVLFNYTVFRNTKDTMIISTAGASATTYLKLYFVTPSAILFFMLYAKLNNAFSFEKTFYVVTAGFLTFMGLFAFVFHPFIDQVQPSAETIAQLNTNYPALKGFISIYANWLYSSFFIVSELWGSVMLTLMFWGFANKITKPSEAKRFYGLFVVLANVALIVCGAVVSFCSSSVLNFLPADATVATKWQWSLNALVTVCLVVGVIMVVLFRWMHTNVLTDPKFYEEPKEKKAKKSKPGLMASLKMVFTSPELGLIVALVICYGVTINLAEVQWKNQIGIHFAGDKNAMNAFMGQYSAYTGAATMIFALFFGANIMRVFSWFTAAVFTPVIVIIFGTMFFGCIFFKEQVGVMFAGFGLTPTYLAVMIGMVVVIMAKAVKYCLFDPTKEMAYIPLDDELKTTGKAAVDVAGGRIGKSGGAFTQSTLLMAMGTVNVIDIVGIAFGVFFLGCIVWIYAVRALNNKILAKQKN